MKTQYHSTLSAADGKGSGETEDNSIRRKWSVLTLRGLLFASICALSAPPVEAQCQWDVSGQWTIYQGSFRIPLALSQNGKTISGTANHSSLTDTVQGQVTGTIDGDNFDVQINWEGGVAGIYRGTISQLGWLEGVTYDKNKPSSTAKWYPIGHKFKCVPVNAASATNPPPTRPPPIKRSGRIPKPAVTPIPIPPTSGTAPASTRKVPWIIADSKPGVTTLTWDGGPDHPYAEVWVKVNDQDEKFVVEKGKGTRQVAVDPGSTYLYILTDSGKRLATVTVTAK